MANESATNGRTLKDFGKPPTFEWVYTDHLVIDESYQRAISGQRSQKLIARIGREFKWKKFGAVLATPNGDGRYNVIDGQHRVEGAKLAGIAKVPCIVVTGLTQAEQADAFLGANDRVNITPLALFHAKVKMGHADEMQVLAVCSRAGVRIPRSNTNLATMQPNDTTAIAAIRQLIALHGEALTVKTLKAIMLMFPDVRGCLRRYLIAGLGRFMAKNAELTIEEIAAKFAGRAIDSVEMHIRVIAAERKIGKPFALERVLNTLFNVTREAAPERTSRRETVNLQAVADGR